MALTVGSVVTTYDWDLRPYRQRLNEIRRETAAFRREMEALSRAGAGGIGQRPASGAGALGGGAAREAAREAAEAARAQDVAAAAAARRAREEALLQRELTTAARAEQQRQTEIARTTREQENAAAAASRRRLQEERERRAGQPGGALGIARTFAGVTAAGVAQLGLPLGGAALVAGTVAAGQESLALERTIATLRSTIRDTRLYSDTLKLAADNQRLFGGTLRENLEPLTSLALQAQATGVSIRTLNDLSQRLQLLSPEQGAAGAGIALREALSGDTQSLVERFELSRTALKGIRDQSASASERLAVLDKVLTDLNVTSQAVSGSIPAAALAFNQLNAELDTLRTTTGGGAVDFFAAPAQGLARFIGLINANPEAFAQIRALRAFGGDGAVDQGDIQREADELNRRRAVRSLGGTTLFGREFSQVGALAQRQLQGTGIDPEQLAQRTQALIAAGEPAARAVEGLNRQLRQGEIDGQSYATALRGLEVQFGLTATQADALTSIGRATMRLAGDLQAPIGATADLRGRLEALAGTSDANRLAVIALADGYSTGRLTAVELAGSVAALEEAQRRQAGASDEAARTTGQLTDEQRKQLLTQAESAASSRALGEAQAYIASISQQVQAGLLSQADGAAVLATRFGFAADEARRLIAEQSRIAGAPALADQRAGERSGGAPSAAQERRASQALRIQQEQARELERARREQLLATGSAAQIVTLRQQEYNQAVRDFGRASPEAVRAETALIEAKERSARAGARGVATGERAARQQLQTLGRIEDRTEDHYMRVLKLQEDYQIRAARSQQEFEIRRARSQEDFERQRRRLLAEGKIFEAQQLEEAFRREQQREQEDNDRRRQQEQEDLARQIAQQSAGLGLDTGRIADRAALRGVALPAGAAGAVPGVPGAAAVAGAVPVAPVAVGPAAVAFSGATPRLQLELRISQQQVAVQIDGYTIVEAVYGEIAERFDLEFASGIAQVAIVAPPGGGQVGGVGGPRP